jgi:2-methylcitrate dehydratase
MTAVERIAEFALRARWEMLSEEARQALKIRVLDSLGCAMGALADEPPRRVRAAVEELDEAGGPCALLGGGSAAPDRAALYNGALVRELDFNDTYFAPGETCHPSDNLAALLAVAEHQGVGGRDLLAALAVAYQVQCRLCEEAPVRAKGFDHTTLGAYAAAAGLSRVLRLDLPRAANALALCGTAFNALRVTRTGALSHWKGLAAPHTAASCVAAAYLAKRGITGPPETIEGNKGFSATIAGPFAIDWSREDLERVRRTVLKRHNAEAHAQTAIEAALRLRREHALAPESVARADIDLFEVGFHIIGGGEEGDKRQVRTKEEADHSLPYLVAVALLDGEVMPAQFSLDRIRRADVQDLLRRVFVRPRPSYSARFPSEVPCRVALALRDGQRLELELASYPGFHREPLTWDQALAKYDRLSAPFAPPPLRGAIAEVVGRLEDEPIGTLMRLLGAVRRAAAPQEMGESPWAQAQQANPASAPSDS